MNKTDKERLLKIMDQVEKFVDELEKMQNIEYGKYNCLSDEKKKSIKGQVLYNNCWLLQPIHDALENVLNDYEVVEDLIDPTEEEFETACYMAGFYQRDIIGRFPYDIKTGDHN